MLCGLSVVAAIKGYSLVEVCGLLLSRSTGSRTLSSGVVAHGLSCPYGRWNLPRPGTEPMSPALAGRCLTTGPPRKSDIVFFNFPHGTNLTRIIRCPCPSVLWSRTNFSQIYSKWDRLLLSLVAAGANPLFTSS